MPKELKKAKAYLKKGHCKGGEKGGADECKKARAYVKKVGGRKPRADKGKKRKGYLTEDKPLAQYQKEHGKPTKMRKGRSDKGKARGQQKATKQAVRAAKKTWTVMKPPAKHPTDILNKGSLVPVRVRRSDFGVKRGQNVRTLGAQNVRFNPQRYKEILGKEQSAAQFAGGNY
jgi:hypothetical protein